MRTVRALFVACKIGLSLLLVSCAAAGGGTSTGVAITNTPQSIRTVVADCGWSARVSAWIDVNANGIRDPGEEPLTSVNFYFKNVDSPSSFQRGPFTTNSKGETVLNEFMPGCPSRTFEIYAELPAGYQITTKPRPQSIGPGFDNTFEFGFAYLPGATTATPRPPRPTCTVHRLLTATPDEFLSDMAITPNGSVWASLYGKGAAKYIPQEGKWAFFSDKDGLVNNGINHVTVISEDEVWFATQNGASRFDGRKWTSYTIANGLVDNNVRKVVKAKDGSVWFATRHGVSHFDPARNTWTNYTTKDGLAYDFTSNAAITGDGTVWLATVGKGISRLTLLPNGVSQWTTYVDNPTGVRYPLFSSIDDIKTDADGGLWIGSLGGFINYDPISQKWANYRMESATTGTDDFAHALAIAPDHSLWIGTVTEPPHVFHFIPAANGKPAQWQLYDDRDGLPRSGGTSDQQDQVRAIGAASSQVIWIGTLETATRCEFSK